MFGFFLMPFYAIIFRLPYGDHDSKPNDCVMEYVNKKWLPFANRKLNKIQAAA